MGGQQEAVDGPLPTAGSQLYYLRKISPITIRDVEGTGPDFNAAM